MKTVIKKLFNANKGKVKTIDISDNIELFGRYVTCFKDGVGKFLILGSAYESDKYHLLAGKDFTVLAIINKDIIIDMLSREGCKTYIFKNYIEAVKWLYN